VQTGKIMFILTGKVLYIAKREIAGKHVKMGPGKKAMYRQPELQVLTGVVKVQLVHQHGQRLQRQPRAVQLRPIALPAVHHREAHTTGVERVAEAIRADVSWVVNHRLAAKAASGLILTRRASSSLEQVLPIVRVAQTQKVLLNELPQAVAASPRVVPEVNKDDRLPIFIS
jgi:hypothetical protein